ncbi:Undecaprenyl phosphate-alpha-4-amino-4-deoxy-L-arabinose arabinosyl transferase [Piscirickettsia salmonis]|uniref:glycosyltransferase family 39 protein n=1 Tax=Piscirickettsia salmonis TaxID=1238 RepID=UPI0012BACE60|nr:glycosyltransferase family 39 protein [Piscirickettsia salmonis]QGP55819.1 Undecaprenyl phosphate-alpha-4-amino-4-deoxy-L-arabinose arabinosyl transferase [Piscirickettsia salmonis]QGP58313.1 Undecaprenyl phosphate-alpha-4-amino-4-deoxy-L-arabinose arabinosyl transferase [Piscirickettsia salmonis]QGP65388.1 Undecaprenyl phosphate-alpha-4-amino-4-deoxy-L-arabinose arabinosyl transferase [Piscirickettsia salmonis]
MKQVASLHHSARSWWIDSLWIIVLVSFFYFSLLGLRAFTTPDEGRYAEIAREMVVTGHYLIPTLDFAHYLQKPPLYYWLVAAAFKLFGISDTVARIPNALFGVLGVWLSYGFARYCYNRRTGLLTAGIIATALLYFIMAQSNTVDMLLTVLLAGCFYSFLWGLNQQGGYQRLGLWSAYALAGLAVLDKGLVGIVFPMMFIGTWMILRWDWGLLKRMHIPSGAIVFLLVAVPWHLLVELKAPGFLHYYFIEQQYERYLTDVTHHVMPTSEYLSIAYFSFFPWMVTLLFAVYALLKQGRQFICQEATALFLLIWPLELVLFFAFSYSKLIPYLLPIITPLAIITGRFIDQTWLKPLGIKAMRISAGVIGIIFLVIAVIGLNGEHGLAHILADLDAPKQGLIALQRLAWTCMLAALVCFISMFFNNVKFQYSALCLASVLVLMNVAYGINPFNTRTTKEIAKIAKPLLQQHPQAKVATYNIYPQDWPFYLGRRVLIVNWRSDEFLYAQKYDLASLAWLINSEVFWRKWHTRPLYVLILRDNLQGFIDQAGKVRPIVITSTKRYVFVANQKILVK